jgi:hypothetical protein
VDTRVLILALVALAGCQKQSKLYCDKHPVDFDNCGYLDAGIDARPTCMDDTECAGMPAAPHCELNNHFCVECYLPEHCVDNVEKKFCDLATFSCTSCVANADCPTNVCLPTGVCGDDSNVAFVDPQNGVDNAQCSSAMKCKTIEAALLTKKPYVKLQGSVSEEIVVDAQTVTFIAEPGTTLTRPTNGVIVDVTGGSNVAIYDLTIIGKAEKGILVDGRSTLRLTGVTVTGCNAHDKRALEIKSSTLIMTRSTLASNIGGGLLADVEGVYQITSSVFYRNGADDSAVGGALLESSSPFNKLELNTFADNRAKVIAGGVSCTTSTVAPNNLIVRNYSAGFNLSATQVGASSCNFNQSMRDTDAAPYAFKMPDGAGPWDYHIGPGSMAIDRGVMSDVVVDIDGETRPQGTKFDVGADEYKP